PIQAAYDMAQMKRYRRKSVRARVHLLPRDWPAPLHDVFARQFERMQNRPLLGWERRKRAAQPGLGKLFNFCRSLVHDEFPYDATLRSLRRPLRKIFLKEIL